jgi:hypothetical protein
MMETLNPTPVGVGHRITCFLELSDMCIASRTIQIHDHSSNSIDVGVKLQPLRLNYPFSPFHNSYSLARQRFVQAKYYVLYPPTCPAGLLLCVCVGFPPPFLFLFLRDIPFCMVLTYVQSIAIQ